MEHVKWQDKMNSIPIKEDADGAWKEMEMLLNQHLPIIEPTTSGVTLKTIVAKLVSFLGYALPAAAMITAGTYIIAPKITENKKTIHSNPTTPHKQKIIPSVKAPDTVSKQKDTVDKVIAMPDSSSQPILKMKPRQRLPVKTSATQLLPLTTIKDADTAAKFNTKPTRTRQAIDTVRKEDTHANPQAAPRVRKRNGQVPIKIDKS